MAKKHAVARSPKRQLLKPRQVRFSPACLNAAALHTSNILVDPCPWSHIPSKHLATPLSQYADRRVRSFSRRSSKRRAATPGELDSAPNPVEKRCQGPLSRLFTQPCLRTTPEWPLLAAGRGSGLPLVSPVLQLLGGLTPVGKMLDFANRTVHAPAAAIGVSNSARLVVGIDAVVLPNGFPRRTGPSEQRGRDSPRFVEASSTLTAGHCH